MFESKFIISENQYVYQEENFSHKNQPPLRDDDDAAGVGGGDGNDDDDEEVKGDEVHSSAQTDGGDKVSPEKKLRPPNKLNPKATKATPIDELLNEISSTTLICRQSSFSSFIKHHTCILDQPYNCSFILEALGSTFQYFASKILFSTFYSSTFSSKVDYIQTNDNALIAIEWISLNNNYSTSNLPKSPNVEGESDAQSENQANKARDDECTDEKVKSKIKLPTCPIVLIVIPDYLNCNSISNYPHLFNRALYSANIEAICLFKHRTSPDVPIVNHNLISSHCSNLFLEHGNCNDLRQAIKFVKCKHPNTTITAIAYSSGCNLLLSYLGEYGSSSYITSSVCISPWFDPQSVLFRGSKSTESEKEKEKNERANNNQTEYNLKCKSDPVTITTPNNNGLLHKFRIFKEKLFLLKNLLILKNIYKNSSEPSRCTADMKTIDQLMSRVIENLDSNSYAQACEFISRSQTDQRKECVIQSGDGSQVIIVRQSSQASDHVDSEGEEEGDEPATRHVNYANSVKSDAEKDDCYWSRNNPLRDIDEINCPVLFICSLDDPLVPTSLIPMDLFKWFPNLLLIVTTSGTHESFIQFKGLTKPPVNWADVIALDFLQASVKFVEECTLAELEQRSNNNTPTPVRQKALTQWVQMINTLATFQY